MRTDLRPLNIGEVLDRTFQIYRSFLIPFVSLAMVAASFVIVSSTLQLLAQRYLLSAHAGPLLKLAVEGGQLLGYVVNLLGDSIVVAAMVHAVACLYQQKPWTVRSVLTTAAARWRPLFGLALSMIILCGGLFVLVLGGYGAVIALAPKIRSGGAANLLTLTYTLLGFSFLVVLPLCVWLSLRYSLCFAVCTFEGAKVRQSLSRSVILSKGMRFRIFLLLLVYAAVAGVFGVVAVLPVTLAARNSIAHQPLWFLIYTITVSFVERCLTIPIAGIGLALFYFDARVRKEGLDIEWSLVDSMAPAPAPGMVAGESPAIG
jgi:hypothetical protein